MNAKTELLCPVCGYYLGFKVWNGNSPSDEICRCCGIQFGYFDMSDVKEERAQRHAEWRKRWIELGMPWNEGRTKPPVGWNPIEQLRRIENLPPEQLPLQNQ